MRDAAQETPPAPLCKAMTRSGHRYDALVAAGELQPDPDQAAAADRLDALAAQLEAQPKRGSTFGACSAASPSARAALYLWGDVGRGKSMLMDLFFGCLDISRKRRVHFAEFMLEVHGRIGVERKKEVGDPIAPVAAAIAEETRLLAFDEMMVTNSPDAMILSRLFTALIEAGVTVVATSNRAPGELYKNGLNREHFLPFIALIEARLDVVSLNGPIDYRRDRLGQQETWLVPNGPAATAQLSRRLLPPDRLSARGRRARAERGYSRAGRADAARAQEPEGRRGVQLQAAVRRRRAAAPTISRSRGAITP